MKKRRKHLHEKEIWSLVDYSTSDINALRDRCLITLCYIHGFRVSELNSLILSDVNIAEKKLNITRLKNGLSTLHPLQDHECQLISEWLRYRATWAYHDAPWFFLSRKGGRLSRQQIYRIIRASGQSAQLDIRAHPHMLRHACGYALAERGIDTRMIQDYLGHRNIQHTVLYTASNAERFRAIKW
jgi:type 1 fimbriae regulatory protein FimB